MNFGMKVLCATTWLKHFVLLIFRIKVVFTYLETASAVVDRFQFMPRVWSNLHLKCEIISSGSVKESFYVTAT